MSNFRVTHTRVRPDGQLLEHNVDTIAAHTMKSAKHALVKRFGLQSWSEWKQTASGAFIRTSDPTRNPHYRGKIIVQHIGAE